MTALVGAFNQEKGPSLWLWKHRSSADVDVQVVGIVLESQDARDDNIITLLDGLAVATAEFAGFDYEAYFEIKVYLGYTVNNR